MRESARDESILALGNRGARIIKLAPRSERFAFQILLFSDIYSPVLRFNGQGPLAAARITRLQY